MTSWNHVCFIIVIIAIVGVIMIDKIYPSPTQPTPIITLTLPNHIGNNNTVNSNNPITTTTPVNTVKACNLYDPNSLCYVSASGNIAFQAVGVPCSPYLAVTVPCNDNYVNTPTYAPNPPCAPFIAGSIWCNGGYAYQTPYPDYYNAGGVNLYPAQTNRRSRSILPASY